MAAGPQGSAHWRVAEAYRDLLALDDIRLELVPTSGSEENAELLARGAAEVALIQGVVPPPAAAEVLAAVFQEPLFVVAPPQHRLPRNIGDWQGLSLAAGAEGSGALFAVRRILGIAGVPGRENAFVPHGDEVAITSVLTETVDAALVVAPLDWPGLRDIATEPGLTLVELDHLEAISGRVPHSAAVRMPAGALSLSPLVPPRDTEVLVLVARLVAAEGVHPAAVDRLIAAARKVHGTRDPITPAESFPRADTSDLPMNASAQAFLASEPGWLDRNLPYWIVAQVNRFLLLVVPILLILVPLLRSAPTIYDWRMRRRVDRHYPELQAIAAEAADARQAAERAALIARLDAVDRAIAGLRMPLAYYHHAFLARQHIDMVRRSIAEGAEVAGRGGDAR